MAKSRSRSPHWKHRLPTHRSPEHYRQRHLSNEGFCRGQRRPMHWDEERPEPNNSRIPPYNRLNDRPYDQSFLTPDLRKPPLEPVNRPKRIYSPERHGEPIKRFPAKYPDDVPHRDHERDLYPHRSHGRNAHSDSNGFQVGRREDNFHEPHHRENDWERRENENHWNQEVHTDNYFTPARRNSEEHGCFQKRYPEDRNFREHGQPLSKRPREAERLEFRPPPRNSQWKSEHTYRTYHGNDWPKDADVRKPSPILHRANSGEFTKLKYDYSHKSPPYAGVELLSDVNCIDTYNRQEERKPVHGKSSYHHRKTENVRKKGNYNESSPKHSLKKCHSADRDSFKNNTTKAHNHKYKEMERNERDSRKGPTPHKEQKGHSPKSSVSNTASKSIPSTETITVNLDLTKPTDKYRHNNSSDRQMSKNLTGRKETFRPGLEQGDSAAASSAGVPKTEFAQEIITIIHEIKANHFMSADITLHERFSKLQTEGNKQDVSAKQVTPQTNPEIHRRFDISLEDLQKKTLNRTDVPPPSQRVIEDPNDLRHDIERRRKERLRSEENGSSDVSFHERESSGSSYRPQNNGSGEFHESSRGPRPPFRKIPGRPPLQGPYHRRNHYPSYSSQSHSENANNIRKPYTGRGNAAMGV
ncbi:BCLAF1 and THRAP3 family member 3 [Spea bombifrons]|uniref:BCLAF1 and THRAP3 family member 3 n=1 Tax=Spea bombifrons TaxID=233779 RepID=UPI00234BD711|nr:BCLAF1 and THRAP3 family member 3 [Spea bombifrons]XP_053313281.1 BCLAF1 and THRAP3 family member 3 [Spea bombifrons]